MDCDFRKEKRQWRCTSMQTMRDALIQWRAKRQSISTKSSAIAEYVALSEGLDELLWLRNLYMELDVKLGPSFSLLPRPPTTRSVQTAVHFNERSIG
mmetsp:Transcript_10876/g.21520  ORF Transcript_10876/g.21520 Transcript_10876/m.21520 type:complete len:97 (-) Transcript_10876:1568-1858(-)